MKSALTPLTTRTLEVAASAGDLVEFLGAIRMPSGPIAVEGHGRPDWMVLDVRLDPHFRSGALGMPRRCVKHLQDIRRSGATFDGFLIGHELPPGTIAGLSKAADLDAVAKLIGPPPTAESAATASRMAWTVTRAVSKAALSVGIATAALASAPVLALASLGLDPVLFGVVSEDPEVKPGSLAAIFYLTSWTN